MPASAAPEALVRELRHRVLRSRRSSGFQVSAPPGTASSSGARPWASRTRTPERRRLRTRNTASRRSRRPSPQSRSCSSGMPASSGWTTGSETTSPRPRTPGRRSGGCSPTTQVSSGSLRASSGRTMQSPTVNDLLGRLVEAEQVLEPARHFHYSNLAFALLGEVVARRSGSSTRSASPERRGRRAAPGPRGTSRTHTRTPSSPSATTSTFWGPRRPASSGAPPPTCAAGEPSWRIPLPTCWRPRLSRRCTWSTSCWMTAGRRPGGSVSG